MSSNEQQQQQQNVFEYAGVSFEPATVDSLTFGIIKLNACEASGISCNRCLDIQIRIDNSGSMTDRCNDGRTKMQHVIFAVSQIIRKVSEGGIETTIDIRSFDDNISQVISGVLTTESAEEMVCKVGKIFPNGGTDIQNVLRLEASHIKNTALVNLDRVFILLSDGQDTTGYGRDQLIRTAESIDVNTHVIMVGVGNDHDSALFKGILSKRISGNYTPVSNVEDISVAISELIYGVLNKVLKQPVITVSNGEVYSWSDNKWMSHVQIDDIVIGRKKTFNVRSLTPRLFKATIEGTIIGGVVKFEFNIANNIQFDADLTYDKYRHRTMELLSESVLVDSSSMKELKIRLKNMMIELKAYMDENKLRDDKKFQVLCDDIFMCHQTMGSIHGAMYASARQTSQGTQSIFNNQRDLTGRVSQLSSLSPPKMTRTTPRAMVDGDGEDDNFPPIPKLSRGVSHCIYQMSQDEEDDELPYSIPLYRTFKNKVPIVVDDDEKEEEDNTMSSHQMLASDDSPYANLKELAFIREISIGKQDSI
jgi:hypothetical protein